MFRTAALYIVGAWLSLQVADVLFPGFGIPSAAIQALVWAAVAGFPVALVFGWLFEVGSGGVHRTVAASSDAIAPQPLGRRDFLLLAAFAVIALTLAYRAVQEVRRVPAHPEAATTGMSAREGTGRLENSIAVLPFANISNDPGNEYFCDGISEEILNALAEFPRLNVIGRTSSFAFKDSDVGVDRISATLGVRHVLQGSVRKIGNQVRISAQLLDEHGRQVWTESFDRELANVFDIQTEIAAAVAAKVASQVALRREVARHPDLDAYDHYLAGRAMLHRRDVEGALAELGKAIEIDPNFAEAHAEWAIARLMDEPARRALEAGRKAIDRALELQPTLLRAHVAEGLWKLQVRPPQPAAAEATLRAVLAQDPNMSDAMLWLHNSLMAQGRSDEALGILQRAARIDPLHPSITSNLAEALAQRGEMDEAIAALKRALEPPNPAPRVFSSLVDLYRRLGRLVELNAVAKDQSLRGGLSHYSTALSYGLIGNWAAATDWLERSQRDFPAFGPHVYVPAVVPGWQGRHAEALLQFREVLAVHAIDISEELEFIRIWYGALLARAGEYAAAIETLEPLVRSDAPLLSQTGPNPQFDGAHALAWSYLQGGATTRAEALLSSLWQQCEADASDGHNADSDTLHHCAETALLRGRTDEALAWLERAIAAGWREYHLRQNDPYWAAVEDDPRYRALTAQVRKDVDRQGAEIARIDARDDFVAKLDAAMAARRAAGR